MPKKQTDTISEMQSRLNTLMVLKIVEKTDKYDTEISELKRKLDYLFYGLC